MRFTGNLKQVLFPSHLATNTVGIAGPIHEIIFFGRFRAEIRSLPGQISKIDHIAKLVATSWQPGSMPIRHIRVEGHADHDALGPKFEFETSKDRMQAVADELKSRIEGEFAAQGPVNFERTVAFDGAALGATRPLVGRTDRTQNRRAEIFCSPEGPKVDPPPPKPVSDRFMVFKETKQEIRDFKPVDDPGVNQAEAARKLIEIAIKAGGDVQRIRRHPTEQGEPDENPVQKTDFQDFPATHIMLECKIEQELRKLSTLFTFGGFETRLDVTRRYTYIYGAGPIGQKVRVTRNVVVINEKGVVFERIQQRQLFVDQPPSLSDP